MLAVVLYHADLGLGGGYVGVDVFFVISGFLITSLIVKDLQVGVFSMWEFWERRARRILPALVAVVLATLAAGWFLLLPADYAALGHSAMWQALFAANTHFWHTTSYFAEAAEEQPLLHTWSLAIEEQFYLLFPLALAGVFSLRRLRSRAGVLALLAIGLTASLADSVAAVMRLSPQVCHFLRLWAFDEAAAYYLLPSRAWELLTGAFIALLPATAFPRRPGWCNAACALGLAGVALPCLLYRSSTPFPGLAALPPCLGAALVVWGTRYRCSLAPAARSATLGARLLAARPLVFVGLVSYPLYLWHWPLLAYANYRSAGLGQPVLPGWRIALVGAAFVLAVLTWHFVERPFRKRLVCRTRPAVFACSMLGIAMVFAVGFLVRRGDGLPQRLSAEAQRYAAGGADMAFVDELTVADARAGRLVAIGDTTAGNPVRLLVWGDSRAMAATPAFDQLLKECGLAGRQATHSATAPVLGDYWPYKWGLNEQAPAFNDAVLSYARTHRIRHVVLIGAWARYRNGATPLVTSLERSVRQIAASGSLPWIMLDVPEVGFDVPRALAFTVVMRSDLSARLKPGPGRDPYADFAGGALSRLELAGARIIDPWPAFHDPVSGSLVVEKNGRALYRDSAHLSVAGAELALLPLLRATVQPVLAAEADSTTHTLGNPRLAHFE